MAPSPSSGGRTPSTRGRGRGRPRLRGRANSLLSGRRRTSSLPASVPESYTPTGRRRPVYQNGYRPGGAGGGGRYIDNSTGSTVPANVYNTTATPAPNRRRAPVTPSVTVADGVYKPREEKSYIEFHPDLDVDATLECLPAEDVDGASYKPPECGKSVKIVDVKEEIEPQEERSTTGSRRWDIGMSPDGNGQNVDEILDTNPGIITSSFTTYSSALNGTVSGSSLNDIDIDMSDAPTPTLTLTAEGVEKPLNLYNINLPIDPALAALTSPPPSELTTQIPIDPALSQVDHQLIPQTPAITPTEEVSVAHPPVTPGPIRNSRRVDDGPTLASLRAHRSNAGKPPLRQTVAHPQSVRRPRTQTSTQAPFEAEKLNLPKPSYRKITPFQFSEFAWSSSVGSTGPYGLNNPPSSYSMGSGKGRRRLETTASGSVDRSMALMGYQQTSLFTLPHTLLRDVPDLGIDEELNSVDILDRVEYDMDEQDDKWLTSINAYRLLTSATPITREIFEITMTKIEKEWVTLEKKIPKVLAKPHSTSFSARRRRTAGDDEEEEEGAEDSKCAICDDGECENSNAIVFCDGCNLAVHQECYGVPYIPEGQWLCRKCLTVPRQTAHCIFCPNTDGAFKQTTTTRWSHLLCAIWIPEVRLANPAYMEPVDGMELVPKSRWRLTCYICKQKMGACIQCSNKSCFIAFHVTCGRRARLHMKMKNTSGPGAQLEASGLKAYCDKHVPADWRRENDVDEAVMDAMEFYHQTMAGRSWGDSQSAAMALPDPSEENSPPNGILVGGNLPRLNLTFGNKRKRNANPKSVWKLPSGAPVIPHVIYTAVVEFLSRFKVYKKEEYVAEACKYWTLKREARRGASLLKRLQLQMNSFTSVEVTRKNYAAMGHTLGTKRLEKRKEFTDGLISILGKLKDVTMRVEMREAERVKDAKALKDSLGSIYFPEVSLMREILEKAES
ncbi:PHD-zinc-finger like domain-containing protein [Morchella snyderi]|nr:PHD-zinc-finger like domain-containing protein [Morchella snyderi]